VSLARNGLSGGLPPSWARLSRLIRLDASFNSLEGPLPPEWGPGLGALAFLNLRANSLGGGGASAGLPPAWAALSSLTVLYLDGNRLQYGLPPDWASGQARLTELSLADNRLAGVVPPEWGAAYPSLRRGARARPPS